MSPTLSGAEFVAHIAVPAEGPLAQQAQAYLRQVWEKCGNEWGMTAGVPGLAGTEIPVDSSSPGLLAARSRPGDGVHQAVVRRVRDLVCLSVVLAPPRSSAPCWRELDETWTRVAGEPPPGVIGVVRVYVGLLSFAAGAPEIGVEAPAAVREAVPGDWTGRWERRGTVTSTGLGVWEPTSGDDRLERRLVVLAPDGHDAELSAWTWSDGGAALPPLANYLLHAAVVRYELRVLRGRTDVKARREAMRDATSELRATLRRLDTAGSAVDDVLRDCVLLEQDVAAATEVLGALRTMSRTVQVATANLAATAPEITTEGRPGLFSDDREVATWLAARLDNDITYVEISRDTARDVAAIVAPAVARHTSRASEARSARAQRFALLQAAAVGAVLMILAAVQSFQYSVALPRPVMPAVICLLGAFALWSALVALQVAMAGRSGRWLPRAV